MLCCRLVALISKKDMREYTLCLLPLLGFSYLTMQDSEIFYHLLSLLTTLGVVMSIALLIRTGTESQFDFHFLHEHSVWVYGLAWLVAPSSHRST